MFTMTIDGADYSDLMLTNNIEIQESLQANGQTLQCTVQKDPTGTLPKPLGGQEIRFFKDADLMFAGRISTVDETQPTTTDNLYFQLSCVDFTVDFDTQLVYRQFDSGFAGDSIRFLTGLVGKGFTSNGVVDGPVIGGILMNYDLPSSFITQIAQSVEYQWYIDYNRDVQFFYIRDRPAPVADIDLDSDIVSYYDVEITEHWDQVKNAIYLTGAQVKSVNQDRITASADGDQKFWALGYAPWSIEDTSVSVDDIPQEILLDNVAGQAGDGQGVEGQVYLCLDNHGVRFPDNAPPAKDSIVKIAYNYALDPYVLIESAESIAAMKERENTVTAPSNGRHEFKFDIPSLRVDDISVIVDYGNLLLTRYAFPVITAQFGSWVDGWKPGQSFTMHSVARNMDSTTFYVTRVNKKTLSKTGRFVFTIDVSTSPFPT